MMLIGEFGVGLVLERQVGTAAVLRAALGIYSLQRHNSFKPAFPYASSASLARSAEDDYWNVQVASPQVRILSAHDIKYRTDGRAGRT